MPERPIQEQDLAGLRINVDEVTHVRQEAYRLSVTASVTFNMVSAEAAYERAREELESYDVNYIDIRYEGEGDALGDPEWQRPPRAEGVDAASRLREFLDDHGSHYVRRVVYGFAVTMRLAREKAISRDRETFRAAVRAVASAWGGGAQISAEHERVISDGHTNVLCVIVAGAITPARERIVTRWQDVGSLLIGARAGNIEIRTGPVRAEVQSFFHTLTDFPNCRALFEEQPTMPAPTPFGVPAGTVIAWSPSAERGEVEIDPQNRTARIVAPVGWALCDGRNGTPNLLDRFVRGTLAYEHIGETSGSTAHSHSVTGWTEPQASQGGNEMNSEGSLQVGHHHRHQFTVPTTEASHVPPYCSLVYIMKL
jgi:hypothetical protein